MIPFYIHLFFIYLVVGHSEPSPEQTGNLKTRTTIVVSNSRYTFYQKHFIKHNLSNTIYQISFALFKYHLSNAVYQIPFIKYHLLNTIYQIPFAVKKLTLIFF